MLGKDALEARLDPEITVWPRPGAEDGLEAGSGPEFAEVTAVGAVQWEKLRVSADLEGSLREGSVVGMAGKLQATGEFEGILVELALAVPQFVWNDAEAGM